MKHLYVVALVGVSSLAACTSPDSRAPQARLSRIEAPKAAPIVAREGMTPVVTTLADRTVYYPSGAHVVAKSDLPRLQEHAKYLNSNPDLKLKLVGHCDERGTNETNLVLGQRRADGVKLVLVSWGVNADQIDAVSYGEEKPVASGHDEAAWSKNRRTVMIYSE